MRLPHALIVAACCALIFWLSSGPLDAPTEIQFDGLDKLAHAGIYALLAGLVFHGLRQSGRGWTSRALFWIPVIFTALYGASDEFHQYFVPTRTSDLLDWLADVTGGLAAATALSLFFRCRGRRSPETLVPPVE